MFQVIADGLDDLKADLKAETTATRAALHELGERMSGQEAQAKNLWHQVRAVEEGVKSIPAMVTTALERHEDTCAGREYVRAKLAASTTKSDVPPASMYDSTTSIRLQRPAEAIPSAEQAVMGVPLPKLVLYMGGGIGAALAGAAYLLIQLGVISLGGQ